MRLDRNLTLAVFHPLTRLMPRRRDYCLPVLMYHSISEDGVGSYYRLATDPRRFVEHLQWLCDLGYQGVSLEEALGMSEAERRVRRPVALTFDDGFRDFFIHALPALSLSGFTATMYLPTGYISARRKTFRGRECLTWQEVKELRQAGIRFGSHTVNHGKLHELPWGEIASETALSKAHLEQEIQEEVKSFAYPYAFPQEDIAFTDRLHELLRSQGYDTCATTVLGRSAEKSGTFWVKRLPANACDDRALFVAKLEGAYDWLAPVQLMGRKVKRWGRRFGSRRSLAGSPS